MTPPTPLVDALGTAVHNQFNIDRLVACFNIEVQSHVIKKNSRPIYRNGSKTFLGKSKELINAEKAMTLNLRSQANIQGLKGPINDPLWVIMHFYFPRERFFTKKKQISRTLPDLSNLMQLPEDCLIEAGIIEDDSQIHSVDLSRRLPSHEYRLEIFLLKYQDSSLLFERP